jgi:hypothetical protein
MVAVSSFVGRESTPTHEPGEDLAFQRSSTQPCSLCLVIRKQMPERIDIEILVREPLVRTFSNSCVVGVRL